jgi:hypothetical protein
MATHAASPRPQHDAANARSRATHAMEWLILESLLALFILVGIVAWTMRSGRRGDRDRND